MNPSNHKNFSIKVWLFSGSVTPILASLFFIITGSIDFNFLYFAILYSIPIGLAFSLPCVLLLTISTRIINHSLSNNFDKKMAVSCVSVVFTFFLFIIIYASIFSRFDLDVFRFPAAYSSTLIFAIWYFPLTLRKDMIKRIHSDDILDEPIF